MFPPPLGLHVSLQSGELHEALEHALSPLQFSEAEVLASRKIPASPLQLFAPMQLTMHVPALHVTLLHEFLGIPQFTVHVSLVVHCTSLQCPVPSHVIVQGSVGEQSFAGLQILVLQSTAQPVALHVPLHCAHASAVPASIGVVPSA